jgi:hypothetical protein
MERTSHLTNLLQSVVSDNFTYPFPYRFIFAELIQLILSQQEFDYFMSQIVRKLRMEYGNVVVTIFINLSEMTLKHNMEDITELPNDEYEDRIERLMQLLEVTKITRIDRNTSDGQMLSTMI